MTSCIDYYLSLNSPWCYLGTARLQQIAAAHNAKVRLFPVDLATVFAETGGLALPKRSPQRQRYRLAELARWRNYLDLPINLEPAHFPVDESLAAGCLMAIAQTGADALAFARLAGHAIWRAEQNLADPEVLRSLIDSLGLNSELIIKQASATEFVEQRKRYTSQAIAADVFAVPSYVLQNQVFWGQDRLDFLNRTLESLEHKPA